MGTGNSVLQKTARPPIGRQLIVALILAVGVLVTATVLGPLSAALAVGVGLSGWLSIATSTGVGL